MENGESKGASGAGDARDPSGFLSEIIGAPVTVKLNSGATFKGTIYSVQRSHKILPIKSCDLQSVDGYMNIALESCKEIHNGKVLRDWGDCFVRGNNVTYICADEAED
ncbi:hypothetical protein K469DRAFT_666016 [Zopfia rhizophila CBS 207.26]|uniref:U6 snRNA-associated Sm-like protein LSm6 n=1 Tax=Zopfia rhizophila CBS 207.26 TaxID=1314779 RepID=A0A6A6E4N5_9PEZI|nr:hypothetical protein K469DRAFT_666016 [Zopfia rhizophila CBS 207.26]